MPAALRCFLTPCLPALPACRSFSAQGDVVPLMLPPSLLGYHHVGKLVHIANGTCAEVSTDASHGLGVQSAGKGQLLLWFRVSALDAHFACWAAEQAPPAPTSHHSLTCLPTSPPLCLPLPSRMPSLSRSTTAPSPA